VNKKFIRNDIQGLRGVAILLVLIFHLQLKILPSGYLGVDLFFVISGYLITVIFFKYKKIGFFNFFLKRLYRIVPSIIFIIFFVSLIVNKVFLFEDLKQFIFSALSSFLFFPNIFFLIDGGYFDGISKLKPLLHLWSLGIEVQFYLFFPLILFLINKTRSKNFIFFISIILILSFSLNVILNYLELERIAFYILPSRLWQFCLGSIIFFFPQIKLNKFLNYFFYINSIILIFYISSFKVHDYFFIKQILIVILGLNIIYFGNNINNDFLFLKNFAFQFLGKISYSLYLCHWPIIVILNYYLVRELFYTEKLILFFIILAFSYIFYFFIENNFRYKINQGLGVQYLIFILMLNTIIIFISLHKNNNLENNPANSLNSSLNSHYKCDFVNYLILKQVTLCKVIKNNKSPEIDLVLLGNSNAQMYGYAFEKTLEQYNLNGTIITINKCLPTTNINVSVTCLNVAKENLKFIFNQKNVKYVFLGLDWEHELLIDANKNIVNNSNGIKLIQSISELVLMFEEKGIRVFVIGPISTPNYEFSSVESRDLKFKKKKNFVNFKETEDQFEQRYFFLYEFFKEKKFKNVIIPHRAQCQSGKCVFSENYNSLFADSSHLSMYGSLLMTNLFLKSLKNSR
jgi:peptidoglycan/LPS O-acetylase OafA/YrhL